VGVAALAALQAQPRGFRAVVAWYALPPDADRVFDIDEVLKVSAFTV
jgi:hypothetical protein